MRWKWFLGIFIGLIIIFSLTVIIILKSYDYNSLKPRIARLTREATGRELTVGGDIRLKIGFTPTLLVENVGFRNVPWGSRPDMVKIQRFDLQVALLPLLHREINIKRLILIEPDILIEIDKSGRSNLKFETQEKTEKREDTEKENALTFGFNELLIKKGVLTYQNAQSGAMYMVMLDSMAGESKDIQGPVGLNLEGSYKNKSFSLTGTFGSLSSLLQPDTKPWPLDLTAKAGNLILKAQGTIQDVMKQEGIKINITFNSNDLKELESLTGKPFPIRGSLDASLVAIDVGPKAYKLSDLKAVLGKSEVIGGAEINLQGSKPLVKADLSIKTLDLRSMLPERSQKKGETTGKEKRREKIFPDDPFPLDILGQMDAHIMIRAKEVILPQLALNDLTIGITLEDKQLKVMPIKATVGGGDLNGNLNLSPQHKGAFAAASVKVENVDIGTMLKDLGVTTMLEGVLDFSANLKGNGNSVSGLMAGLNGEVSTVMGRGRIMNKYIDMIGSDLSSSIFRLFNPGKQDDNYTDINCFVTRFDIKDGVADTTAMVFDTKLMTVIGEGKINLASEKFDIGLRPSPKEELNKGVLGKISLSIGELAKPFKLGGTFSHPSLALDPTQAVITVGKAVGGMMLFGPAGIAASLLTTSRGEENPCLAALDTVKTGAKVSKGKTQDTEKGMIEQKTHDIKKGIEDLGKGIKSLF